MPQRLGLNSLIPMTVDTFLSLGPQDVSKETIIHETGIQNILDSSMHTLSGGEFQRVMLARALLNAPNMLILDEPTQGLDTVGETLLFQLLEHLHKHHNIAVLMVSHDLHFVHKASQNVVCLNHHVCCSGSPQDIQDNDVYKDIFNNAEPPTLKPYVHDHSHTHDNLDTPTCSHKHSKQKEGN